MPWTVDLVSLDGVTTHVSSAPFKGGRITWAADGIGAAEFNLRTSDVDSGTWLYGRRRVVVRDGLGTARFAGWLDRLERAGGPQPDPDGADYRASARGLVAGLDMAVVHGDFTEVEQPITSIMWALIDHANGQTHSVLNFTQGAVVGTPDSRTRDYCDGDVVGEALRALAEEGGIDWEVTPAGVFKAWVGSRGTDLTGTYTLDPTDCRDWQCTADTSEMATYVTGFGRETDGPCGDPLVIDSDTSAATTYGRREVPIATEGRDEFEVEDRTAEELRARIASRINLRTAWMEGRGPWDFGDVWVGDTVVGALGTAFGGNVNVRCIGITVTMDDLYEVIEMEWEAA